MNIIDRHLLELGATEVRIEYSNGNGNIIVQRAGAPSVQGQGDNLQDAVRDALEQARLGNTVMRVLQGGERLYRAFITQKFESTTLTEEKIFVAEDDQQAHQLAQKAFGDRDGNVTIDVKFRKVFRRSA